VERKLFVHNMGHAVAAYLGYHFGKAFIHEAMAEPPIPRATREAMRESSRALARKHALGLEEQLGHVDDLLRRFANPALRDTVTRVGRDPLRKLRREDRLVGAALLALEQGVDPRCIIAGIAAALRFDAPDDPSAATLQAELEARGLDAVLEERCGLPSGDVLAGRIRTLHRSRL
jgi:mannitol-1-phosphate 5-dehydrogenase